MERVPLLKGCHDDPLSGAHLHAGLSQLSPAVVDPAKHLQPFLLYKDFQPPRPYGEQYGPAEITIPLSA